MNSMIFLCVGVTALMGAGGQVEQAVQDSAITTQIETEFLLNKHLNPFNINTTTKNGIVTLTGSVSGPSHKQLAEELASTIVGVDKVNNNLTVIPAGVKTGEERTMRQKWKDSRISMRVRTRMLTHQEYKALKIGITTINAEVTLYGLVPYPQIKDRLEKVAKDTKGVAVVHNDLIVQPKRSKEPIQYVTGQVSDEWLEKRVETALLLNQDLSLLELAVEVDDGVCILTGTASSEPERDLAGSLAKSINGIEKVRNEILVQAPPVEPLVPLEPEQ